MPITSPRQTKYTEIRTWTADAVKSCLTELNCENARELVADLLASWVA